MTVLRIGIMVVLISLYTSENNAYCQSNNAAYLFNTTEYLKTDSGLIINYHADGVINYVCVQTEFIPYSYVSVPSRMKPILASKKQKLISVNGQIAYDFYYRSRTENDFAQEELQQHTEKVWLNILVKDKYPFKFGFTAKQSNSDYLYDLYNVNLQFDKPAYTRKFKQELLDRLTKIKWQDPDFKMLDTLLKQETQRYHELKNWVKGPETLQRIIEARERAFLYYKSRKSRISDSLKGVTTLDTLQKSVDLSSLRNRKDSILNLRANDSIQTDTSFLVTFVSKKAQLDSLEKYVAKLKQQYDSTKKLLVTDISKVKHSIQKAEHIDELNSIATNHGINTPGKQKFETILSSIRNLTVGRSVLNYTELTAKDVLLSGFNVEYNPSYYAAFAVGKIDFGFRDFMGRGIRQKNQHLVLGRLGWGNKEKRSFIITFFNGRKNNYTGSFVPDSINASSKLYGYSIQTTVKHNETILSIEVAKSTKNQDLSRLNQVRKKENLFNYGDHSNLGININAETTIPGIGTRLTGYYRKTGEEFQSFSLFTYNTNQQSFQIKGEQSFNKDRFRLITILSQNDFKNLLTDKTFKTSTIFKTVQLNITVPKWPIINLGYYPGTQVYIIDKDKATENAYYFLNASASYSYSLKDLALNSSIIYSRYFNKATDSGFVLHKGNNYFVSQTFLLNKIKLYASYAFNKQPELVYTTVDANAGFNINKNLSIGAGIKHSKVEQGDQYIGKSMNLSLDLKLLGAFRLDYDKSYLPSFHQKLHPVEIGRLSWYKTF